MQIPLQQTKKWQKFLDDTGATTFFEETDDFTYLAELKTTPLGNYLYLPYGPYTPHKNSLKKAFQSLQQLAIAKKAMFIRIEPQTPSDTKILRQAAAQAVLHGPKHKKPFKIKKSHDLDPADTWVLDLTPDKSAIISGFTQGTRTRYNQFAKKGLSVTTSKDPDDIKYLVKLQHKLAQNKKIGTFSEKYLKKELEQDFATLYLVHYTPADEKTDKIIAASLFFDHADTRYYMQSAADLDYRKLPATVALLTTAIFDAKDNGLKKFDFWGIAPDGAPKDHPWAGFTDFKKSFGGQAVHYSGTYDLVLKSFKYTLYKIFRVINRLKRRIFSN
ncbi:peptidoglycan bridge formation glycyltransferase FemA/FemB family protein [Candidatus Saccharibacteria bacterium]|nr:peptidoglycan bridge formation glycyltransferase FemA/FemB family protein [Candidatus Saccharibacteria bacterium]